MHDVDTAPAEPLLELTMLPGSLACAGVLSRRTRRHVLEAVQLILEGETSTLVVDVSELQIADVDGANALAHVQRMVREAGAALCWRGLDSSHLRGLRPLQSRPPHPDCARVPRRTARTMPAMVPPTA